jgi:hypothetical protein
VFTAVCFAAAVSLAQADGAGAAERVNDGGFEASTCDASDCTDKPTWEQSSTSAFSNGIGPICRSGTGSGNTACTAQGSGPFTGSTWARFGAGFKATAMFSGGIISSLEQQVALPNPPATLSFRLRIINSAGPTGEFTVEAGGAQVFAATDLTSGFATYAPVTIDLSSLAGGSTLLRLEGFSTYDLVGALDSFDVDGISLITVDPSTTVGPKRKKCRKHKRKRSAEPAKRKKCKKRRK